MAEITSFAEALPTPVLAFAVRLVLNVAIVAVARALLGGERIDVRAALFLVAMLSLITLLHDRYLPVHSARVGQLSEAAGR